MPKIVPKSIQTCFERVLGQTFEKFLPSFPWKVESSKIFKKIKKVSNFLKCQKSFPKVSKRVLNVFWSKLSKNFCPVFHGRSSLRKFSKKSKKFQIPKMPKIVPKSIQTCFERVLGQIFSKNFMPSVTWREESSKIFKKKSFQNSKNAQKCSQKYTNVF